MALAVFSVKNIQELDSGMIAAAIDKTITEVVKDCGERPTDKTKRHVTVKFVFEPLHDPLDGDCSEVQMSVEIGMKTPSRISRTFSMRRQKNNQLMFNSLSPDNAKQRTIDEASGET